MSDQIQHVYPIGEEKRHDTSGGSCICCPSWYNEARTVLVHNELSGLLIRPSAINEELEAIGGGDLQTADYIQTLESALNAIIGSSVLIDENGLSETEHHCEWALAQERKRIHRAYNQYMKAAAQ